MIESFVVYTFFAFIMYSFAISAQKKTLNQNENKVKTTFPPEYKVCLLFFFLVSGLRYGVGVDYFSYLDDYQHALAGNFTERARGYEEGYKFITIGFGSLGLHPIVFFGFLAVLQLFFVVYAYRKEKYLIPIMMLVLMLGGYFFVWTNGIRQSIAACIFVFSISYIKEKRMLAFFFCMLLAFTWHRSSLILIPFFLLAYDKSVWNKRWILLVVAVLCLIIGNTPFWINNIAPIGRLLGFIGYDFYEDKLEEILIKDSLTSFSLGPRLLGIIITYLLIVFYYPKARLIFPGSNIDITFKLCYIGICGYFLFLNTNLYFLRPIMYFTIFAMPMTAYTIVFLKRKGPVFFFYLLLLTSLTSTYFSCWSDTRLDRSERKAYLYHFYFEKE